MNHSNYKEIVFGIEKIYFQIIFPFVVPFLKIYHFNITICLLAIWLKITSKVFQFYKIEFYSSVNFFAAQANFLI